MSYAMLEYKPIPGYEECYEINREGQVRSMPRWTGTGFIFGQKQLREYRGWVSLCKNGKVTKHRVQDLVEAAFGERGL